MTRVLSPFKLGFIFSWGSSSSYKKPIRGWPNYTRRILLEVCGHWSLGLTSLFKECSCVVRAHTLGLQ